MVSYFKFNYPLNKKEYTNEIEVDEDGDMVVQRRKDDNEKVLKIGTYFWNYEYKDIML